MLPAFFWFWTGDARNPPALWMGGDWSLTTARGESGPSSFLDGAEWNLSVPFAQRGQGAGELGPHHVKGRERDAPGLLFIPPTELGSACPRFWPLRRTAPRRRWPVPRRRRRPFAQGGVRFPRRYAPSTAPDWPGWFPWLLLDGGRGAQRLMHSACSLCPPPVPPPVLPHGETPWGAKRCASEAHVPGCTRFQALRASSPGQFDLYAKLT